MEKFAKYGLHEVNGTSKQPQDYFKKKKKKSRLGGDSNKMHDTAIHEQLYTMLYGAI